MLDLHAHILPGIDDGPRTLDDAIALVRAMADDGIEHVVATPHIYPGVFDNTPARIADAFDALQRSMAELDVSLTMSWAAEVRICPEVIDWLEQRRLPLLNGGLVGPGTVLIELPDGQIPMGTDRLTNLLLDRGITPLIAHPERNKAVMELPARLEGLRRSGCKFQLTAGSLLGDFGTRAHATARALLDAGWVDVVATDAHNRSSRRPRLSAARDWLTEQYDEALATRLTQTQPKEIAGIDSFSLHRGKDRLVFRDLPNQMQSGALPDQNWSAGLQLDESLTRPVAADGITKDEAGWSLTDFRIDSVLDDLHQASLQAGAFEEPVAASTPALPEAPAETPEDWKLPAFAFSRQKPAAQASVAPPPRTEPRPLAPSTPRPAQAAARPEPRPTRAAVSAPTAPPPRVEPLMPEWVPEQAAVPAPAELVITPRPRPGRVLTLPVSSAIPTLTATVRESVDAAAGETAVLAEPQAPLAPPPAVRPPLPDPAPVQRAPEKAPEPVAQPPAVLPQPMPAMKGLRLSDLPSQPQPRERVGAEAGMKQITDSEPARARAASTGARMAPQRPPQGSTVVTMESLTAISTRFAPPQAVASGTDLGNGLKGFRLSDLPPVPPSKR